MSNNSHYHTSSNLNLISRVNVVSMKICKIFTKMVEIIIRIMVMFLMMTMNGYVNICIVVAMMLGYLVFRSKSNPVCNGYKRI